MEAKILPKGGAADRARPKGPAAPGRDRRRSRRRRAAPQAAERHADVRLYGEVDQTATIVADKQPQIEAAAGFARLNALARARKAAGFEGPLGWHRSQVLLGMLNGTLPPIPPAEGAPPDHPGPSDGPGPWRVPATAMAATAGPPPRRARPRRPAAVPRRRPPPPPPRRRPGC